ncbi:Sirodesmin biosynthesis O [Hyphodiscus hymeniophilus]|uniref:Sirodesmin biosynthesis O n=1 Tax=Hyphodiscus hymeniophilus TaxID=353542 RepID=A0A9P6VSZ0_9HELO|nr:Sirodesmin biosynthesis O [Hyphodiscus hymeniophilus]
MNGQSEAFLGNQNLPKSFKIITKAGMAGGQSREGILANWKASQEALKTEKVPIYLLHHPANDGTPISDTMEGIQELYLAGKFEQFGLSNFSVNEVEECFNYAKSKNYVLPTVYQSIYGLAARQNEKELFPVLRRLGISIQAYSSLSSGFLVKTPAEIKAGVGNFNHSTVLGKILQDMYGKPVYLEFLDGYAKLAEENGISKAGMAYRWVVWNSALKPALGDCVVLGASSAKQMKNTVEEIDKGPLGQKIVSRLDRLWQSVENDAPQDNFATYKKLAASGAL